MKNWRQLPRLLMLSSGCLVALPVTCNSILAKRSPAGADEYEYVTVSGTNIKQRVKKGTAADTPSSVQTTSAEQFRRATEMATKGPSRAN